MVKLGWRLQQEKDSLWARILTGKYKYGRSSLHSNAWKGVIAASPFLEAGTVRSVRNGESTRFWMDRWLTPYPLRKLLNTPLSLPVLYAPVNEYWEEGRGWKWDRLRDLLPSEILQKLAAYVLSDDTRKEDEFAWYLEHDGSFSVASAYEFILSLPKSQDATDWLAGLMGS